MSDIQNIVLAAANVVGPRESLDPNGSSWEVKVAQAAEDLIVMANPNGKLTKRLEELGKCFVFPGIVAEVGIEESSQRGYVAFATKVTEHNAEGIDTMRTERIDSDPEALAMVKRLHALIGHQVLIWKHQDTITTGKSAGRKVRILRRFEDLGKITNAVKEENLELLKAAAMEVRSKANTDLSNL